MVDRYTKTILTIIATALVAIVARDFMAPAAAQRGECGGIATSPCYIAWGLSEAPCGSIRNPCYVKAQ